MNSGYTSQQNSQASSRMQSPLVYKNIPKHPFAYSVRKFINKIPPAIRYGLPGAAIGAVLPKLYEVAKNKFNDVLKHDSRISDARELRNSTQPNDNQVSKTQQPAPSETPIPRSTFNPLHPRTGYRYHAPFD